jgi:hypothetical protein
VTTKQARVKAHQLWGTPGIAPGDRVGFVSIRRKNVVDRFEVGHYTRVGRAESGAVISTDYTIMGRGQSWEEAFERANTTAKDST